MIFRLSIRQRCQRLQRLGQFLFAYGSGDVMTDHAPKTVRLHRGHFSQQILNQCPANRRKGVAIVKAEGCELVAAPAEIKNFPQSKFAFASFLPKLLGWLVAGGSGFVQRLLFLTQTGIDRHHGFPRPILQPVPLHLAFAGRRLRFALMRCNVPTPSLLR